jgi:hypothetical protein
VLELKQIFCVVSLLFFSVSCSSSSDKVAVSCKENFALSSAELPPESGTLTIKYLIDYKQGKVFSYDDNRMEEMKKISISPKRISFLPSYYTYGSKSIDRTSLAISGNATYVSSAGRINSVYSGTCEKTTLPNLSSSGKKI